MKKIKLTAVFVSLFFAGQAQMKTFIDQLFVHSLENNSVTGGSRSMSRTGRTSVREHVRPSVTRAEDVVANASGENFPVALRMLPARHRRHLTNLYFFARLTDDLGDEAREAQPSSRPPARPQRARRKRRTELPAPPAGRAGRRRRPHLLGQDAAVAGHEGDGRNGPRVRRPRPSRCST